MKRLLVAFLAIMLGLGGSAQVFNTAKVLKTGTFAVGIEPALITKSGSDFALFGHVGYGLAEGIDIALKASTLSNENYYAADIEVAFMDYFSIAAGAHVWGEFGLDATFLGSYELAHNVDLYGGVDVDLNLGGNTYANFWIPVGVEVLFHKNMAFLLEASVGLNGSAPHIFGGGINVYF